jgi:type I restriction enzyme, S subunit
MSDLPSGWEWATLDDLQAAEPRAITDGPFGSNLTSAHYTESGARVIRLQNIGDGVFVDGYAYISLDHYEKLKLHNVRQGDLVIASLGSDLPRACIAPELGAPAIVKADCIRVRLHPSIDVRWVLYALISPQSRRYVANRIRGVGRPRLGLGEIRKIPIPIPPPADQAALGDVVDGHLSAIKDLESTLRGILGRSNRLRTSVIAAAVGGSVSLSCTPGQTARKILDEISESRAGIPRRSRKARSGIQGGEAAVGPVEEFQQGELPL